MASPSSSSPSRLRKSLFIFLILLSLFLIGTVIVLSSATWFFGVPNWALLTEGEVALKEGEVWTGGLKEGEKWPEWDGLVPGTEEWSHLEDIALL
jgi:hypothetical protein